MDELISRLDNTLKESKKRPIAVFDIDSTIFNVSPRNQVILEAILDEPWLTERLPKEVFDQLKNTKLSPRDWGLAPLYKFVADTVKDDELKKKSRKFWSDRFFTNEYLVHDEPYDSCIAFIQKLEKKGFEIMYLTGRDDDRMRLGTLNQLKKWKLPLSEDKKLITKPHKSMLDGPYKESEIQKLLEPERHLWFFDNEPSVLHHCDFDFDNYQMVFIDSVHSSRAEPKDSWLKLSFENYPKLASGI